MNYEADDEMDVAQGIYDALSQPLRHKENGDTGILYLGWDFEEPSLGEIDITIGEKRYRLTVNDVTDEFNGG